ncbi:MULTISPECIES: histidine phosphatase family protein [Streptomyces]|uniref:Phosphoserine phosphatase 1 n=2 Tax=Streptomyces TaxID=1883 RepID=A0A1D8FY08_9ACTN|nr:MULTISPECIES: histidine phosphatase family protein [Streptomyces]AOT58097.1 Phosphoserine phosphatase 1 [Streptomyces rubrolavendulae]KAF0649079.1 phosphoglycerate mutase [Streptomyces fradiae ATCC 10745 = DSM 40063]OSY53285.1 Phosphoserine phosphatase 1 [Streptomyces fradiae ATCC 10745 = DSM 40063]QEV11430.1 MSMEG_4193 family putative phosphomutase [Streptomyces fradiae ATCC 10745 = DSM 40063]UQS28873.1 MSMEG_4193 family putative phosphomutase [Streptomyces fradiae]
MATLILVRHGRSTANTAGVLAGRTPGVTLDDRGAGQAAALPGRLAGVPLALAVTSPLQRCRETLAPLLTARPGLALHTEERISECDYGDWSGRKLAELADEPLMDVVQHHPSAAAFPGGESMRAMQSRAVDAVRDWNARVAAEHGDDAAYVMCSHGDIIKALVADALGLHLDLFQRLHVDPCSVTAIRYTRTRPFLVRLGDTGDFGALAPRDGAGGTAGYADGGAAQVGGGAGAP